MNVASSELPRAGLGALAAAAAPADSAGVRRATEEGATPAAPPKKARMQISAPTPVEGPHPVTLEEFTVLVAAMQEVVFTRENLHSHQQTRSFDPAEDRKDDWVVWNQRLDAGSSRGAGSR